MSRGAVWVTKECDQPRSGEMGDLRTRCVWSGDVELQVGVRDARADLSSVLHGVEQGLGSRERWEQWRSQLG